MYFKRACQSEDQSSWSPGTHGGGEGEGRERSGQLPSTVHKRQINIVCTYLVYKRKKFI